MPKPYDATTKRLVDLHPKDWLRLLGVIADTVETVDVEMVDSDLAAVTAAADRVFRVKGETESLHHLELESGHHGSEKAQDLLNFNVLTSRKYRLPVETSIILLGRKADSPALDGSLSLPRRDGSTYLRFEYNVLRLWKVPVEQLLTGGIGTLPLAPLAKTRRNQLPEIVQEMQRRFEAEAAAEAGELWTATKILMGLRYSREITNHLLKGVRNMRESVTYQEILEEGELKGERQMLLRFGEKKLGPPSPATKDAVAALSTPDQLFALVDRIQVVKTWDELLAEMN